MTPIHTHTPGPWRIGEHGSVVADHAIHGGVLGTDDTGYYGGYLIAESIAPCNLPLIAAAPRMLSALRQLHRSLDIAQMLMTEEKTRLVAQAILDDAEKVIVAAEGGL